MKKIKLPKLNYYRKTKVRENLNRLYNEATEADKKSGENWYLTAHEICLKLQEDNKNVFTLEQIAGVIAALSPRNKWERNILDAANVLRAVRLKKSPEAVKVCTFNKNKQKAFNIAKGEEEIKPSSKKTFAFVNNIARLDKNFVTIDLWHLRACFGATIDSGLTPKIYDQLQEITIEEAEKNNIDGFKFQAVIWESLRNKNIY